MPEKQELEKMRKFIILMLCFAGFVIQGFDLKAETGAGKVQAMKLGDFKVLPAEKIKAIEGELAKRLQRDQEVRTDLAKRGEMKQVDRDNTAWLKKTIKDIGWIDCDRFSLKSSCVAFALVQHSGDLPLMLAVLPLIEKDVRAKKYPDAQVYCLLYDRLNLCLKGKQRYATQIGRTPEGWAMVLPLEDCEKVEQFRREIGIGIPLQVYLKSLSSDGVIWFTEDYKLYKQACIDMRAKKIESALRLYEKLSKTMSKLPPIVDYKLAGCYKLTGKTKQALRLCEKLSEKLSKTMTKRPKWACLLDYHLACCYALTGKTKQALASLQKAVDKGFRRFQYMENPDLDSIRNTKEYAEILKKIKGKTGQ